MVQTHITGQNHRKQGNFYYLPRRRRPGTGDIAKIVVLVSEPVRGRSRATELPCYIYILDIDSH